MSGKWKKVLAGVGGLLVLGGMGYYAMHHGGEKNSNNGSSSGSITDVISGGENSNYFADDPEFPYDWESYLEKSFDLKVFPKKFRDEINEILAEVKEKDPLVEEGYSPVLDAVGYVKLSGGYYEKGDDGIKEYLWNFRKYVDGNGDLDDISEGLENSILFLPPDFKGDPKLDRKKFDERRKKIRRAYLEMVKDAEECVVDYYNRHPEEWGKTVEDGDVLIYGSKGKRPKSLKEFDESGKSIGFILNLGENKTIPEFIEYNAFDPIHKNMTLYSYLEDPIPINPLVGDIYYIGVYKFGNKNDTEEDYVMFGVNLNDPTHKTLIELGKEEGIESCKETEEDIEELKKYSCDVNEEECEKRIVESSRRYERELNVEYPPLKKDELYEKFKKENKIFPIYRSHFLYSITWNDLIDWKYHHEPR